MFRKTLMTLSAVAGLGLAAPAFAHPYDSVDQDFYGCREYPDALPNSLNSDYCSQHYRSTADRDSYRTADDRYYRSAFDDRRSSRFTKCVYFDQKDGRFYQTNCQ